MLRVAANDRAAGDTAGNELKFLATDGVERFAAIGGRFLGQAIDPETIELIDL